MTRGLVILIIDTLRSDFEVLCGTLPNFARLKRLCSVFPTARCGSFPTGPMRTDLLTGRLSFLDSQWAHPETGEATLPRILSDAGLWTTLVSDNYVAVIPRIGGMLLNEFDSVDFIRGAGSDPWMTPSRELLAQSRLQNERLPSRSVEFEIQYLANAAAWDTAGGTPTHRVFVSASRQLEVLERHDRFLLWVDSFACHEPWDSWLALERGPRLPELPLFPGYVKADRFPTAALASWKANYIREIEETDRELGNFITTLEDVMRKGDVALAVLSDHGFLFGEYGFVGKPPDTPLPPQLHEIVCWLSSDFEPYTPASGSVQPHVLNHAIRSIFGLAPGILPDSKIDLFGRNSPRSDFIAAATATQLFVGDKSSRSGAHFLTIDRDTLNPTIPLVRHGAAGLPPLVMENLRAVLATGRSPWVAPFRAALSLPA